VLYSVCCLSAGYPEGGVPQPADGLDGRAGPPDVQGEHHAPAEPADTLLHQQSGYFSILVRVREAGPKKIVFSFLLSLLLFLTFISTFLFYIYFPLFSVVSFLFPLPMSSPLLFLFYLSTMLHRTKRGIVHIFEFLDH
jgi:hypothetical protein